MIWIGVPVVDQHALTQQLLASMVDTVVEPENLHVVLFDNGSDKPYDDLFFNTFPFKVGLVRYDTNHGYYQPINDLASLASPADIVALCHNDLIFYEAGWDRRIREAFAAQANNGLGMIGFCGSNEVDDRGGRGGGTMVNFRGEKGAKTEHTGRRVTGLEPALVFDSLFMAVRASLVPLLRCDEHFQLCHFGDRVWPLRLIERGIRCAVLGIDIDHIGGQTAVGIARIEADNEAFCRKEGITIQPGQQAGTAMYLWAERNYLSEYRDVKHLVPARMNGWQVVPGR